MRMLRNLSVVCGLVSFTFAAGCGSTVTTDDGGTPDMAATATADMTALPDLTQPASMPDMTTQPDMTAAHKFSGTMLLQEVHGFIAAGGQPVAAAFLAPVISFSDDANSKPSDYDNRPAAPLGCYANWYDLANGRKPVPDADDQPLKITGYSGGNYLGVMMAAPSEINCVIRNGFYTCGYGPLVGGNPGPDPSTTPLNGSSVAITPGSMIEFIQATAGTNFGTFDVKTTAKDTLTLDPGSDLNTIRYDPAADKVLTFKCADVGGCGATAALVTIVAATQLPGTVGFPGMQYGQAVCVGLAFGNSVTVDKGAIKAALGPDATKIKTFYTRVVRGALPGTNMDSKGNSLTIATGRGQFGFSNTGN